MSEKLESVMSEIDFGAIEHVLPCRIFEKLKCIKEILGYKVSDDV